LRHNFKDACVAAGIQEEVRMKFMGHQLPGVHGAYGNPRVLKNESDLIDTINFAEIELWKYKK